jgi:NADPH-dependent 2,4-dienoyl-CoA reductase/sulfur reductase-like enzyme
MCLPLPHRDIRISQPVSQHNRRIGIHTHNGEPVGAFDAAAARRYDVGGKMLRRNKPGAIIFAPQARLKKGDADDV